MSERLAMAAVAQGPAVVTGLGLAGLVGFVLHRRFASLSGP